jgi:hypothetical protein
LTEKSSEGSEDVVALKKSEGGKSSLVRNLEKGENKLGSSVANPDKS